MKAKKVIISTLTVLSVATSGMATLAVTPTPAVAKAKAAKVVKTTKYKSKHKVHVRGGWMYSSTKLTHKNHHMTNYLYTKFYATKTVTVRKANGKTATLKYLTSKNGKIKGYVHSTYVWNQWGYGKYNVKDYRKKALSELNRNRKEHGLYALKETAKLDKVAQKNSDRMLKDGQKFKPNVKGVPHAGWIVDDYAAQKSNPIIHYENGTQWGQGTIFELMGGSTYFNMQHNYQDFTKYLLSKNHTQVGFGGTQRGQVVYMFVLLSHH